MFHERLGVVGAQLAAPDFVGIGCGHSCADDWYFSWLVQILSARIAEVAMVSRGLRKYSLAKICDVLMRVLNTTKASFIRVEGDARMKWRVSEEIPDSLCHVDVSNMSRYFLDAYIRTFLESNPERGAGALRYENINHVQHAVSLSLAQVSPLNCAIW